MVPKPNVFVRLAVCISAVLAVVALVPASAGASPAIEAPDADTAFIDALNEIRVAGGLQPLLPHPGMSEASLSWTRWMTDNDTLQHADDIVTGSPPDWEKVGENVGRGANVEQLVEAFMASPGHAANVMDPSYTHIGVGTLVTADGLMYTTHRFAAAPIEIATPPPILAFSDDIVIPVEIDEDRLRAHYELLTSVGS